MANENDTGAGAPTQPSNLSDKIDRHLKGERVTDEYLNLETGEIEVVPEDQDPEFVQIPFLGVANANEVPITEPGGRATELLELSLGYLGEPSAVCHTECECWGSARHSVGLLHHDEHSPAFELLSDSDRQRIAEYRRNNIPRNAEFAMWLSKLDPEDEKRVWWNYLNRLPIRQMDTLRNTLGAIVNNELDDGEVRDE